jgi:hypothetical protein
MGQKVNQVAWTPENLAAMLPVVALNPWGASASEVLGGSQLFEVEDGAQHILISGKGIRRGDIATLEITGMVSLADRIQTATLGQALDNLATVYAADILAMYTPHPHLQRGAVRLGFAETGRLFQKQVNPHGRQ